MFFRLILLLTLVCGCIAPAAAQDVQDGELTKNGVRYLDLRLSSLTKFARRADRQQQRLLHRLVKRERRYASQLKQKDSAAYARYLAQGVSFDSLAKLDTVAVIRMAGRLRSSAVTAVDSLRAVSAFLTRSGSSLTAVENRADNIGMLSGGQRYRDALTELIGRRSSQLSALTTSTAGIHVLSGIQKDIFYTRSRIAAWKKVADDPDAAEAKALEYLQGTPGFDGALLRYANPATTSGSDGTGPSLAAAGNGATAADLERMGLQTRRQVGAGLQQRFGSNTTVVQQQLAGQLDDWQKKAGSAVSALNEARAGIGGVRSSLGSDAPGFRLNPMRGLPFWQRLERSYNFTAQRATGERPALLQLGYNVGFRHTPKLSYGLGAALETGLGQDWQHIRISFEGIGLRSYAAWQIGWGFGAYAGYERTWKGSSISPTTGPDQNHFPDGVAASHETANWKDAALVGISKRYKLSRSKEGTILLLYDIWWRDKGLSSPIQLRLNIRP